MDTWDVSRVIQIVLIGLVLFPAIALFALIFSKPGAQHDHSRRWVDYTKAALGFWSASHLLSFVSSIMVVAVNSWRQWGRPREYDAISYLFTISSLAHTGAQIALLLALFHLAHALTQFRSSNSSSGVARDDSAAHRIGRKLVRGASVLIALVALAAFALDITTMTMMRRYRNSGNYDNWETFWRIYMAETYLYMSNIGILTICAIAILIYAVMSRRKAGGSPVEKAATLLVVSASLWLLTFGWSVIFVIISRFAPWSASGSAARYVVVVDICLGLWPAFGTMLVLYILASKSTYYGLSGTHLPEVEDNGEQVL